MITLEQLQEAGGLAGGYKRVAFTTAVSLSKLRRMSEEEQSQFNGTVIIDNCQWAATTHSIPIAKASAVYSSDGKQFGCWRRDSRTFFELEFIDNKLAAKGQYKLPEFKEKENKNMANEFSGNIADLANQLSQEATSDMGSFNQKAAPAEDDGKKTNAAKERREKVKQELDAIRSKVSGESIVDRSDAILNNQKNGRFICFITKTDPSLRLSVKKVPMVDENGNYIPVDDAPEDVVKKAESGEKKLPVRWAKTEQSLVFRHTKPSGKPVGAVIATPVASEIPFTKLVGTAPIIVDSNSTDKVVRFLDANELHPYIATNYDKKIKEDDRVLGARATALDLRISYKEVTDEATGARTTLVSASLAPEKKEGRTSLLVDGNFVPLKLYNTINQQDLTTENKATLNLLIEQALSKGKSYEDLDAASKAMVHPNEDGSYTSDWFDKGAAINVDKYDKSGALTNVQLPVLVKKLTKKTNKFVYQYTYSDLDSENGPLAQPQYQQIIALTGKTVDEFKEEVKDFARKRRSGSTGSSATPTLSAEEYLMAIRSKNITVAGADSFKTLQQKLEGLE